MDGSDDDSLQKYHLHGSDDDGRNVDHDDDHQKDHDDPYVVLRAYHRKDHDVLRAYLQSRDPYVGLHAYLQNHDS